MMIWKKTISDFYAVCHGIKQLPSIICQYSMITSSPQTDSWTSADTQNSNDDDDFMTFDQGSLDGYGSACIV